MPSIVFDVAHDEAFVRLGALPPGQQWSSFDVSRAQAIEGHASLFVTSIWNYHSIKDKKGKRDPTDLAVCEDSNDGTLWYKFSRPPAGAPRKTWVAHWNRLQLAVQHGLQVKGVLKDVKTLRCSLEHQFVGVQFLPSLTDDALWLELRPLFSNPIETRKLDIDQVVRRPAPSFKLTDFEKAVEQARERSSEERKKRLALASKIPRRISVTTSVFVRNPDVVAEVLHRAGGKCESCRKPAPFAKKVDGTLYLEVQEPLNNPFSALDL